jgi:hypothetical protein
MFKPLDHPDFILIPISPLHLIVSPVSCIGSIANGLPIAMTMTSLLQMVFSVLDTLANGVN